MPGGVGILPGPDLDVLPTAGAPSSSIGWGVCRVSVTTNLSDPYLEVTVFVIRGERVLGGQVPDRYGDITRLEVVLADQ